MTQIDVVNQIIEFCDSIHASSFEKAYLTHLFQSLSRFVEPNAGFGELKMIDGFSMSGYDCICQHIVGSKNATTYLAGSHDILMSFAEKYSDMTIEEEEYDELAIDCLSDFLNLNNGLFLVEYTDEYGGSQTLQVPEHFTGEPKLSEKAILIPALFSFGCVHFILN